MSAVPTSSPLQARRHRLRGRFGDLALHGLTLAAALGCLVLVGAIVWKIFELSGEAFDQFGLAFVTGRTWDPVKHIFGALPFIYGTAVTSLVAVVLATPLAIAIGLYLSELAPRGLRGIVGSLVELLAAIPSVVLGLWGILVLGPFLAHHVEPWLHSTLGFIPLFGDPQQTGQGLFTAAVILTIMIVPIVASISRELFLGVPRELEEGALALGATRARAAFGVMVPAALPGIMTGILLALARIAGETAPLLFTSFNNRYFTTRLDQPIASLTVQVFTYAISPYDDWHRQAWAGALVLVALVFVFSVLARTVTRRLERMHRT